TISAAGHFNHRRPAFLRHGLGARLESLLVCRRRDVPFIDLDDVDLSATNLGAGRRNRLGGVFGVFVFFAFLFLRMPPELRQRFNGDFTREKYAALLRCVNETEKWPADFRVSETPIFLTREF